MSRTLAVAVKELRQARRDTLSLGMLLGLPTFMLLIYGYALNFDVTGDSRGCILAEVCPGCHTRFRFPLTLEFQEQEQRGDGLLAKFTGQRLPEIQEPANLQILSLQKSPSSSGAFWHRLASQGEPQVAVTGKSGS